MIVIKKKDWIEIALHIVFWAGIFYMLLSLTEPHIKVRIDNNGSVLERDIRHPLSPHIFLTLGFMVVLFYSNIFWLFKKAVHYKHILIRVILPVAWFSAIFFGANYLDTLLPKQNPRDPVLELLAPPQGKNKPAVKSDMVVRIKSGSPHHNIITNDLAFQQTRAFVFSGIGLSNTVFFLFIIVFGLSLAYFFLKEWARAQHISTQLQAVQLDTEVKFLKSQINPHFLFNTLNNLFSMAQGRGNDELADGISKLSGMMRYMIYESNAETVPLKKEIEYLENCITLNKLRYADDEALVIFGYPEQVKDILIAPMIFIPFVENAFKHGVLINKSSQIDIAISIPAENQVLFTCENQNYGFIKKMDDEKSGVGLENVKRRLALLYPGKYDLAITHGEKYLVTLKINLQ